MHEKIEQNENQEEREETWPLGAERARIVCMHRCILSLAPIARVFDRNENMYARVYIS